MPRNKIPKIITNTPEINLISVEMTEPNSSIKIHKGDYILKYGQFEISISGHIEFDWFPNYGVHFFGTANCNTLDLINITYGTNKCIIVVNSLEFGQGFITNVVVNNLDKCHIINGRLSQKAILGERNIVVDKIQFSVPNLREFHGYLVKSVEDNSTKISMNRILLEDEEFVITIDKCKDYDKRKKSLEDKGGYNILYAGELTSKKGNLSHENTKDVFQCLNAFLTFLNGRRTSALFIKGKYKNEEIWCDYTDYMIDSFKQVQSWPQRHSIDGMDELWLNFRTIWQTKDDKDALITLVHWYVEANNLSGFSEGSIIMAQTALELIYNWWIIEQKKIIIGKDSDNISASNKIRLLLSQINIDSNVPDGFTNLKSFLVPNNLIDGPEAIVYIRNAIVHSQQEKRKKLSQINSMVKFEALQLYIWYIELSLLCILNFKAKYYDRSTKAIFSNNAEKYVPWKKLETY